MRTSDPAAKSALSLPRIPNVPEKSRKHCNVARELDNVRHLNRSIILVYLCWSSF